VDEVKPFDIPKREVWEAFKKVKANQGAAGVDGQTIADFEADLTNNLYELWNRLSSGSYFPPPVRRVDIPKVDGGTRPLGIPTVADRVAQRSCPSLLGAAFGAGVSCRLLRLQARQIGDRRCAPSSSALLAPRLGARSRRKSLLRQHRLGVNATPSNDASSVTSTSPSSTSNWISCSPTARSLMDTRRNVRRRMPTPGDFKRPDSASNAPRLKSSVMRWDDASPG
jgi:hypothetical protein